MAEAPDYLVLDTSCVVALVCGWHERHDDVRRSVERELDRGLELGMAAHTLVESFAVLTRLPPPHRLRPEDALSLLERNFEELVTLRTLRSSEHWPFLRHAVESGVQGGATYDALIARAARKLEPCKLLTLNPRHFAKHDSPGLTIETV